MKISIIIPTIRKEKLLDLQLPSYIKQTFPKEDFEIIIIDDYISSEGKDGKDRNGNRKDLIAINSLTNCCFCCIIKAYLA